VTLEGIDWLDATALGAQDRALGRVLARSELWARLPAGVSAAPALERWRGADPVQVRRTGEGAGLGRTIDVRRALLALDVAPTSVPGSAAAAGAARLGWDDDPSREVLRLELGVSQEGSARPLEVIEGLLGPDVTAAVELARVALWADLDEAGQRVDPLALEALRRPPSTIAVPASTAAVVA
jgi:hypothetical protein